MNVCLSPTSCLAKAADTLWDQLAVSLRGAAGSMVTTLFGWWTTDPSLDVDSAVAQTAQRYVTAWVAVPVAVLALLAAVAWGVLAGTFAWIGDVGRGLIVFGVTAAGSLPLVSALQDWSTALAKGLLSAVPAGDVGERIIKLLDLPGAQSPIIAFWAVLVLIVTAIQYLLMLFRDGAVLVLAAVLPIAAAGQFSRGSIAWLPRVAGWLLAFIFVKPAAALIYYLGISLLGQARGVQALATAVCLMIAAIAALPAMLKLVTFAVTSPGLSSSAPGTAFTLAGLGASLTQASAARRYAGSTPTGSTPTGSRPTAAGASGSSAAAAGAAAAAVPIVKAATAAPRKAVTPGGKP